MSYTSKSPEEIAASEARYRNGAAIVGEIWEEVLQTEAVYQHAYRRRFARDCDPYVSFNFGIAQALHARTVRIESEINAAAVTEAITESIDRHSNRATPPKSTCCLFLDRACAHEQARSEANDMQVRLPLVDVEANTQPMNERRMPTEPGRDAFAPCCPVSDPCAYHATRETKPTIGTNACDIDAHHEYLKGCGCDECPDCGKALS